MIYKIKKFNNDIFSYVYFLFNNDEIVYIGSTAWSIKSRLSSHKNDTGKVFTDVYFIEVPFEQRLNIEKHYIDLYKPKYNYTDYKYNKNKYCKLWDKIPEYMIGIIDLGLYKRIISLRSQKRYHIKKQKYCKLWNGLIIKDHKTSRGHKFYNPLIRKQRKDREHKRSLQFYSYTTHSFCTLWDGIAIYRRSTGLNYLKDFPYFKIIPYKIRYGTRERRSNHKTLNHRKWYCKLWNGISWCTIQHKMALQDIFIIPKYPKKERKRAKKTYKSGLRQARWERNLRVEDLMPLVNIASTKLSELERGNKKAHWEEKVMITRFFNKPETELFNNEPLQLDRLWYGMNNIGFTNGYFKNYKYRKHP